MRHFLSIFYMTLLLLLLLVLLLLLLLLLLQKQSINLQMFRYQVSNIMSQQIIGNRGVILKRFEKLYITNLTISITH